MESNEQNKNRSGLIDTGKRTDNCQGRGVEGLGKKDKGLKQYRFVVVEYQQRWGLQHGESGQ